MCSIILRIGPEGVFIGANRDEMINRAWASPGAYWPELPGVVAGRDLTAGGTWLAINRHGVVAAVLNRTGTLGPAPGKHSRGELPLLALGETTAATAAAKIAALDAGAYRSFNVVVADKTAAFLLRGLEAGVPEITPLGPGTWMITSGEANDMRLPRIARHLPEFEAAAFTNWPKLLADNTAPDDSAVNIPPHDGFGTVCSSVIALPRVGTAMWDFAAGPPHQVSFAAVNLAGTPQPG